MEEYFLLEEAEMIPVLQRRRRVCRDFLEELSNEDFFSITRFTKDGATLLASRLEGQLQGNERGRPLTPLHQVFMKSSQINPREYREIVRIENIKTNISGLRYSGSVSWKPTSKVWGCEGRIICCISQQYYA